MKRFIFSCVVLVLSSVNTTSSAVAEAVERPWKNSKGSASAHNKTIFGKKIEATQTGKKPRVFIRKFNTTTAPKREEPQPTLRNKKQRNKVVVKGPQEILPAKVRVKTRSKVRTSRVKRGQNKTRGNALWWDKTGNPAVFAFRDCAEAFAVTQTKLGKNDTAANIITASMKTSCQLEFAKMAGVLIGGLGEEKSNEILTELAQTTFLPTVKLALEKSETPQPVQVALSPVPTGQTTINGQNRKVLIAVAKKQMFACFIERTDRLSVAKSTLANTIATAVIAGCKRQSDVFFDNLFANSKATPQVIDQQKNMALNEVYHQAIVKRVLVTRGKAKLQTATGTTTVAPTQ